ncbi:MAG: hypothetical protein NC311_06560 [Muribaculaceae bacterium]|nr:hypothetical protein [Muribaculaceae bacterium]
MNLSTAAVMLEGSYFRVEDYPWEAVEKHGPFALKKGIAYRYQTDFSKGLFPYRGLTGDDFNFKKAKIGIWFKQLSHSEYKKIIVYPRTPKQAAEYKLGTEKDIIAAVLQNEFLPDQFADSDYAAADSGASVYMPPIHTDDDSLNMLMKLAIREKGAPFEPYGRRLQAMAVDKRPGTERSNAKNNAKRGIMQNRAMSMGKFAQYSDAWQLESAIIVKDLPHAMHPMHIPKGKMLVIYPGGLPFTINQENLIDVSDMIAEAISNGKDAQVIDDDGEE